MKTSSVWLLAAVRNQIAKDLAQKGIVQNDANPDLLVGYHVKRRTRST